MYFSVTCNVGYKVINLVISIISSWSISTQIDSLDTLWHGTIWLHSLNNFEFNNIRKIVHILQKCFIYALQWRFTHVLQNVWTDITKITKYSLNCSRCCKWKFLSNFWMSQIASQLKSYLQLTPTHFTPMKPNSFSTEFELIKFRTKTLVSGFHISREISSNLNIFSCEKHFFEASIPAS